MTIKPTRPRPAPAVNELILRRAGTIVSLNQQRGFGFVLEDQVGEGERVERFFHCKQVVGACSFEELVPGDPVTFEAATTSKGPRAYKVRKEARSR